jgi:hypothetical protein
MFLSVLTRFKIENDHIFDWMIPKKEREKFLKDIKRRFKISAQSESLLGDSNGVSYSGIHEKSSLSDSVSQVGPGLGFSAQGRSSNNDQNPISNRMNVNQDHLKPPSQQKLNISAVSNQTSQRSILDNSVSGAADGDQEIYVSGMDVRQVAMACQDDVANHILSKDYMIPYPNDIS